MKTRVTRLGKIIRIIDDHCKVDFFSQTETGLWKKDGSGSDNVFLHDVIVIKPGVNKWDSLLKVWAYVFPKNVIEIVNSYFEK